MTQIEVNPGAAARKIEQAREAFEDSVRLFPGSDTPIFGHSELEALLEAVRAQERMQAHAAFDQLSITHKRTLIDLARVTAEREEYANRALNEGAGMLDQQARAERAEAALADEQQRHARSVTNCQESSRLAQLDLYDRIAELRTRAEQAEAVAVGLREHAEPWADGAIISDMGRLRVALNSLPVKLAGQVKGRHLRDAAEVFRRRVDAHRGHGPGALVAWHDEAADVLEALAKEAET
jgi:hypothetical protein